MKKLVIAGSASLPEKSAEWKRYWSEKGYKVIGTPDPIPEAVFVSEYPAVFRRFFEKILEADVLFVMNENKNGIRGYIGAEVFAEAAFAVAHNQIGDNVTEVIMMQEPDSKVQSYSEIMLWLEYGWVKQLQLKYLII